MVRQIHDRIRGLVFFVGTLVGLSIYFFVEAPNSSVRSKPLEEREQAAIYSTNCAVCHGRDGRAKTAKGKRLGATDFTSDWNTDEARGIRIITNGRSEMPSFKKKLSASEIRSVFAYIRRFRG